MDALTQAIKALKSLGSEMRRSKTAFDDLVQDGVIESRQAHDYLEDLNDEEPEVAQKVAEVLKKQKSASIGFGKAASNPSQRKTNANRDRFSDADTDLLNMDFGG